MRYYIDGYNVILAGRIGAGAVLHERRGELLARIAASGVSAFVAFDSREAVHGLAPSVPRRVEVAFARGQSGDELLLAKLRSAPDLRDAVAVSDDHDVADRARFLGVRIMAVREFVRLLKPAPERGDPDAKKEKPLSRSEVADWMRWFGEKKDPDRGDP